MIESTVQISMQDDNNLECSYAIVNKGNISIIIVLKDTECGILDYNQLKEANFTYRYLLLKHYNNSSGAYKDFLKLIGKMCKKHEDSKYFQNRKEEDNRMVCFDWENEHMITDEEKAIYKERYEAFKQFILYNQEKF